MAKKSSCNKYKIWSCIDIVKLKDTLLASSMPISKNTFNSKKLLEESAANSGCNET